MNILWHLDQNTGQCEWIIESPDFQFRIKQPLQEFLNMTEGLHRAVTRMKELMSEGLDAASAIQEVERIVGPMVVLRSKNREALADMVVAQLGGKENVERLRRIVPDFCALTVENKVCGRISRFPALEDLPVTSVPCPCGNPNHWMIKYDEETPAGG